MVCLQNEMSSMDESMELGNNKNNSQCFLLDPRVFFLRVIASFMRGRLVLVIRLPFCVICKLQYRIN